MNDCPVLQPGCVTSVSVQPFFLQALDKAAPWIPTAYQTQLPWCITWKVTDLKKVLALFPSTQEISGTSPPPRNAFGRVVGGFGGETGSGGTSHYTIEGGQMAWVDGNGQQTRIPMTADAFLPSQGASLDFNGFLWSSSGSRGAWKRSGDVWTFEPIGPAQQSRVRLKLDFGGATFDVHMTNADLQGRIPAGDGKLQLKLVVNGQYTFHSVLHHEFDIVWRWSQTATQPNALEVTSMDGRFDTVTKTGKMSITGTLPANRQHFGDMGLEVNGRETVIPLLDLENFEATVLSRGVLRYVKQGLILVVDFGTRTWTATFNN
jgi:hypothetical protein